MPALNDRTWDTTKPVFAAQAVFRAVMDAMARPGQIKKVAAPQDYPEALMPGTAAIALTLFDHDTPVWLDGLLERSAGLETWLKFETSAPITASPAKSHFAVVTNPELLPALDRFPLGSDEYPDRSATLILEVNSLTGGPAFELTGPGIDGSTIMNATMEPPDFFERLAFNHFLFPRGLDTILVAGDMIAALPRTLRITPRGL